MLKPVESVTLGSEIIQNREFTPPVPTVDVTVGKESCPEDGGGPLLRAPWVDLPCQGPPVLQSMSRYLQRTSPEMSQPPDARGRGPSISSLPNPLLHRTLRAQLYRWTQHLLSSRTMSPTHLWMSLEQRLCLIHFYVPNAEPVAWHIVATY